ncbi:hypothetical protein DFH08DRAFT_890382 [Mycena albidolilacea]|uniref:Uncharacterized protein n=1 Tax=Mycena albidolilacea TaxID=1033008 RepID=A0AAD6ZF10_9AGAR|nr:hypothetical protein DFH08DRAFT_890382 [Mycena albidolilacea]
MTDRSANGSAVPTVSPLLFADARWFHAPLPAYGVMLRGMGLATCRTASAMDSCVRSHSRRSRARRRRLQSITPTAARMRRHTGATTPAMIGIWWLECEASRTVWAADSDGDTCDEASVGVGSTDGMFGRPGVVVTSGYVRAVMLLVAGKR